ncbi:MAG: leucine-rich repeat domain-containing protein, partial [Opitutales bacterium]
LAMGGWNLIGSNPMRPRHFKYKAFISYSHKDKEWGDWLHKSLESYRIPFRLARDPNNRFAKPKLIPKRLYPVFRDREELPTSSDLGTVINQALKDSSHLIVICSPRSAQSQWVNEEIEEFKRLGRTDRILCLIIDGEPNASEKSDLGHMECFPDALKYDADLSVESFLSEQTAGPIAADARDDRDGKRNAFLKLVAGLINVGFDDLKQRDTTRQRKRSRRRIWVWVALGISVLGLVLELLRTRHYLGNMESMVRILASKSDYLDLGGDSRGMISDLSLLAEMTNLTGLNLNANRITDLTPLAKLTNLERLDLAKNTITKLGPLSELTHLKTLNLSDNKIKDITPLAKLNNCEQLDLGNNYVADLSPLANWNKLIVLRLEYNQINDLAPLAKLTHLENLFLTRNPITEKQKEILEKALPNCKIVF